MNLNEFNFKNVVYDFCMYYNNQIQSTAKLKSQDELNNNEFTLSIYNNIVDARIKSKICCSNIPPLPIPWGDIC